MITPEQLEAYYAGQLADHNSVAYAITHTLRQRAGEADREAREMLYDAASGGARRRGALLDDLFSDPLHRALLWAMTCDEVNK